MNQANMSGMFSFRSLTAQGQVHNPPLVDRSNLLPVDESSVTPPAQPNVPLMPKAVMLPAPLMGGISTISAYEYSTWTGGKPKADWSGLIATDANAVPMPNQLCPTSIRSAQGSYNYWKTGLTHKMNA